MTDMSTGAEARSVEVELQNGIVVAGLILAILASELTGAIRRGCALSL